MPFYTHCYVCKKKCIKRLIKWLQKTKIITETWKREQSNIFNNKTFCSLQFLWSSGFFGLKVQLKKSQMVPNKPLLVSGFSRTARKLVISYGSPPADGVAFLPQQWSALALWNPRHRSESLLTLVTKALSLLFWFVMTELRTPSLQNLSEN